jgi:hypothetical protein
MVSRLMVIAFIGLSLTGCEADEPCAAGPMTEGPGGMRLTRKDHPTGWGHSPCSACHVTAVLHRTVCTPEVDLAAVRARVQAEGEASCAACHGDNGVGP